MSSDSLITIGDAMSKSNEKTQTESHPPGMKSMNVVSYVRNRYARTVVTSKYANPELSAQQATFSIVLPDTAFIAGFVMEIKGKKYEAYVKEKEEAKQEYQEAISNDQSAAHVEDSARDSNKFTVSVNVEPQSDVTFILTYEELLVRKHSKYELLVNLHPGQLLEDLGVDIHINETRPIVHIETLSLRSGNEMIEKLTRNEYATIIRNDDEMIHVSFHPTIEQQKEMAIALADKDNKTGTSKELPNRILGQFIVEYDVERDSLGGEVLINDGYFAHFFAPIDLEPIPKHVIFVLDVSTSMEGRKINQLKEAMKVILNELNPEDYFNLVKFSDEISVLNSNYSWNDIDIPTEFTLPQSFSVNVKNIKSVQNVVDMMSTESGTNISDALIVGLRLTLKGTLHLKEADNRHKLQPIIVFLTDGLPSHGESDPKIIIEMVEKINDCSNKSAIFTLAFGNDADNTFLKELAVQNSGFLRNIYEASDASLQLQYFYKQISSPLLTDVYFKYPEDIKEVTQHNFDILFDGSEFVVAGKVEEMADDGFVYVEGSTFHSRCTLCPYITTIVSKSDEKDEYASLERLWAYMTIKQLLDKKYEKKPTEINTIQRLKEEETAESQALKLALKYSFVTPVTSLVLVQSDESTTEGTLENNYIEKEQVQVGGSALSNGDEDDASMLSIMEANVNRILNRQQKLAELESRAVAIQNKYALYESNRRSSISKSVLPKVEKLSEVKSLLRTKGNQLFQFFSKSRDDSQIKHTALESIKIAYNVKNHVVNSLETRKYVNLDDKPQETTFTIILPDKTIFIEFAMKTEGQKFIANGFDKIQTKREYENAVLKGVNAMFVNFEDLNKVTVSINIEPKSEIKFILKYEKWLELKDDKYEIVINIAHETSNNKIAVDAILNEKQPIKNLKAQSLRYRNRAIENKYTSIIKPNDNEAHISFHPTIEQQKEIIAALNATDENFSGQFIVEYVTEDDAAVAADTVTCAPVTTLFPYLVAVKKCN